MEGGGERGGINIFTIPSWSALLPVRSNFLYKIFSTYQENGSVVGSGTAMTIGGTTLVHCGGPGGDDRAAHLAAIPSGALAPSLNLNTNINSALNSTLGSIGGAPAAAADAAAATWPPTLWQYSATAAAGG